MIYAFTVHSVKKISFLSIVLCISIQAMENKILVHPALLDPLEDIDKASTFDPSPEYLGDASLVHCLQNNHHVKVYSTHQTLAKNSEILDNVLEFTTYGNDALQWIIPENKAKESEAWKELSNALTEIINKRKISKIIFRIQSEGNNRLKKIKSYSCLLHVDEINMMDSILNKLKLPFNIKIHYLPVSLLNVEKNNLVLYSRKLKSNSNAVILAEDIKIELLLNWDPSIKGYPTQASQSNNANNDKERLNTQPIIEEKKFNTLRYWLCGGGALLIIIFSLYSYNKSKNVALKKLC